MIDVPAAVVEVRPAAAKVRGCGRAIRVINFSFIFAFIFAPNAYAGDSRGNVAVARYGSFTRQGRFLQIARLSSI